MHAVGKRNFIFSLSILRAMTMSNTVLIHIPDWLSNEVSLRMDEKLSIIKIDPANIWQRGPDAGVLLQRYPVASKFVAEKKYLYPPLKKYL